MKVMQEHIDFPMQSALKVKWQNKKSFTYPWHFHHEIEILYVIEGSGTSFVADNVENFNSGDLAILGSNLPHFWRSDEVYSEDNDKSINYIVIQFSNDLFPESLFKYSEFQVIQKLYERASRGIRFNNKFSSEADKLIKRIARSSGFERIIMLMKLLNSMATTKECRSLAGALYDQQNFNYFDNRLTKVLHYLNTGYQQKIDLNTIAEIANLHPSSFCRYFKDKTGKSLSEYIIDLRLSYACRLITEGNLSVSQVCFESGFNNLSNFNRKFKHTFKMTPTEYYHRFHQHT